MTTFSRFGVGSVSYGTLRAEDLLPAFTDELKRLDASHPLLVEAYDMMASLGDNDNNELDDLVNEIQDALNDFAPPFTRFGAHDGDGADFGWWSDIDALNEARKDAV